MSNTAEQLIRISSENASLKEQIKGLKLSVDRDRERNKKLSDKVDEIEKHQKRILKWINVGWTLLVVLWAIVQYFGVGNVINQVISIEEKKVEKEVEKDMFKNGFGTAL